MPPDRSARQASPEPTSSAAPTARPTRTPTTSTGLRTTVVMEDLLDRLLEEPPDRDRERQRRQVPTGLDRVDRLARHPELHGQLSLAQPARLAEPSNLVLH